MQQCRKCKITIRGTKERCPLCEGPLMGTAENPAFPAIPPHKVPRLSALRLALFLFIAFEATMVVLCFVLGRIPPWVILAMLAGVVGIADVALTLYYRNDLLRLVTWEIYLAMVVVWMVDFFTGRPYWSVIWVLPVLFVGLMITTVAIAKGIGLLASEYIVYLLLHAVVSTGLQLLFLLIGWNTLRLPAIISIAFVLVFFAGMVLFHQGILKQEARKLFNV